MHTNQGLGKEPFYDNILVQRFRCTVMHGKAHLPDYGENREAYLPASSISLSIHILPVWPKDIRSASVEVEASTLDVLSQQVVQ
jgi:hypothetical protein